jgi:hypothetical protein
MRIRIEFKKSTATLADCFDMNGYGTYWQEYSLKAKMILVFCMGSVVGNGKWQESRIIMYISTLSDGVTRKFISHKE